MPLGISRYGEKAKTRHERMSKKNIEKHLAFVCDAESRAHGSTRDELHIARRSLEWELKFRNAATTVTEGFDGAFGTGRKTERAKLWKQLNGVVGEVSVDVPVFLASRSLRTAAHVAGGVAAVRKHFEPLNPSRTEARFDFYYTNYVYVRRLENVLVIPQRWLALAPKACVGSVGARIGAHIGKAENIRRAEKDDATDALASYQWEKPVADNASVSTEGSAHAEPVTYDVRELNAAFMAIPELEDGDAERFDPKTGEAFTDADLESLAQHPSGLGKRWAPCTNDTTFNEKGLDSVRRTEYFFRCATGQGFDVRELEEFRAKSKSGEIINLYLNLPFSAEDLQDIKALLAGSLSKSMTKRAIFIERSASK